MFSVYGASGRLFRGTLEQLRQIGPVQAVDRTRSVEPVARDGRTNVPQTPSASGGDPGHGTREHQRSALAEAYAGAREAPGQRWGHRQAGAVMTHPAVVLQDSDTLPHAWRLLGQQHHAQAPVVNAQGVLVGLVTLVALARQVVGSGLEAGVTASTQTVANCMVTPVPSVAPGADLRRVAGLLLDSGLPALPVVDDAGRVEGLISRGDILRAVLDDTRVDQWG